MGNVIGVDLGGTNIFAGRVDEGGQILARRSCPTPVAEGADAVIAAMGALAAALRDGDTRAIGAVSPGLIDAEGGLCIGAACNIPGWEGMALAGKLSAALGLPAFAENDGNAAALAENWIGAGRGARVCLMLTLGTGIGGGAVVAGQVFHGAGGVAAEFGHISIDCWGEKCPCGGTGCSELYASASGLARLARETISGAGASQSARMLAMAGGQRGQLTAKLVCEAARAGDRLAASILDEYAVSLAATVASLINAWNPDCVVVGGGLSLSWDLLEPRLQKELAAGRALPVALRMCRVVPAALRDEAGVVGAAKVAWNRIARS
jgi:glucokinase